MQKVRGRFPILTHLRMVGALLLTLALTATCQADNVSYTIQFQQEPSRTAGPTPTGGFIYDASTGHFSSFRVLLGGATVDFTDHANELGGNRRLPFELGFLAQNLISGVGIGPTQWYVDDSGFRGFEWRTPAADFLYYAFYPAPGSNPNVAIFGGPNAYSGTWTTSIAAAPVATPEPGTLSLTLAVCAALLAVAVRRRSLA